MMLKKKHKKLVIIAAGGTGGHLFPAQSLSEQIIDKYELHLITDQKGEKLLSGTLAEINRTVLNIKPISGNISNKVNNLYNLVFKTILILFKFLKSRPKLVIGFGGYPSFPSVAAATLLKIPIIIHEQNSLMGKVNRIFAPFAKKIATSFQTTLNLPKKHLKKVIYTGNPIRSSLLEATNKKNNSDIFKVLVIGGSQGANIFGKSIPQSIQSLPIPIQTKISIYHQVREELIYEVLENYQKTSCKYDLKSFYHNIGRIMNSCDLVIARSGASTIAELIALSKPCILIPFAAAAHNHQYHNAKYLEDNGSAILIDETTFGKNSLTKTLLELIQSPEKMKIIKQKATAIKKIDATKELSNLVDRILK